jgi:phospho-N-acetylmuramoyl-pentapeptide-transferase
MLYYLFDYLNDTFNIPGAGVFQYISFRAAMAIILSLTISMIYGKNLIAKLRRLQVADEIREFAHHFGHKTEIFGPDHQH